MPSGSIHITSLTPTYSGIQLRAKKSAPETRGRIVLVSPPREQPQAELAKGTWEEKHQGKLDQAYRRQAGPCDTPHPHPQGTRHIPQATLHPRQAASFSIGVHVDPQIRIFSSLMGMSTQLFLDGVPGGSLDLNDSYPMALECDRQKHLQAQGKFSRLSLKLLRTKSKGQMPGAWYQGENRNSFLIPDDRTGTL